MLELAVLEDRFGFPFPLTAVYFLHFLVVSVSSSDISQCPLLPVCVLLYFSFLDPTPHPLFLTARTCKVSIELNNTRKWLHSDLDHIQKGVVHNCNLEGWTLTMSLNDNLWLSR